MILVEFTGLPGSGKTTLCDKIEEELRNRKIRVRNLQKGKEIENRIDRILFSLYTRRLKKAKCNKVLLAEIEELNRLLRKRLFSFWEVKILEANYRCIKAEKKGIQVALFDEGCIQYIEALLRRRPADERVSRLIKEIENKIYASRTVIVYCELDEQTCYDRILKRGRWCADLGPDKSVEFCLESLRHRGNNIDLIAGQLENVKMIKVSTKDSDSDKAFNEVLDAISTNLN